MEPKAVFYILKSEALKARDLYACRLVDKAYQNERRVYVYVASPEEAISFNTQLWTFHDISFVPHEIYKPEISAPVVIGWEEPLANFDVLLNLTLNIPSFFKAFNHIIEVIPNISEIKAKGREKYKYYHGQKIKLETHEV